ncbi:MAG: hypothetical protein WCF07_11965 [Nitrososphaeraceae archaeon]
MLIRQDREKIVVELHKESKSYRDVSKIARISVRKPILQKYGANNVSEAVDSGYCSDNNINLPTQPGLTVFAKEYVGK